MVGAAVIALGGTGAAGGSIRDRLDSLGEQADQIAADAHTFLDERARLHESSSSTSTSSEEEDLAILRLDGKFDVLANVVSKALDKYETMHYGSYQNPIYRAATDLHPACALLRFTTEWPITCPIFEEINKCEVSITVVVVASSR